jgi:UDP-N-acetylglucosamine 2-epimerase
MKNINTEINKQKTHKPHLTFIFGTRPEIIKMYSLIIRMSKAKYRF